MSSRHCSHLDRILNQKQKRTTELNQTFKMLNFSLFYREIFGMPGYILMGLRQLDHWTWVEPPPKLPLLLLMMPKEKISLRFRSMAMNIISTHTVSSATGKMKLRKELMPNLQRYSMLMSLNVISTKIWVLFRIQTILYF